MAHYIITGSYSPAAMKGMIASPSDREAATRALIEASGGKMLSFYLTTGDSDFCMTVQADNALQVLPGLMAAGASGAVSNLKTVEAFTAAEFKDAQARAAKLVPAYRAPA